MRYKTNLFNDIAWTIIVGFAIAGFFLAANKLTSFFLDNVWIAAIILGVLVAIARNYTIVKYNDN